MQMHYVDKERVETCPIETPPPHLQLTANFRYYTYIISNAIKLFLISYLISAVTMF